LLRIINADFEVTEHIFCIRQVRAKQDWPYKRNIEVRSRNHCCHGKTVNNTYSECVFVTLVIQNAMRMRRIMLSSVACMAVQYFPHYLINGTILGQKVSEHKMCVLIFCTPFL